ncbi:MAG: choice-of-anchor D domain-containing protein [Terriglobia bacterium]
MGRTHNAAGSRRERVGQHAIEGFLFGLLFTVTAWVANPGGIAAFPQAGGPAPMNFGNQEVGTHSPGHSFKLFNTGATVLVFHTVQATANFGETDTCKPSVPVGGNCEISVTFDPTTVGPLTGTLTVTTNAVGPPYIVKLSGTGTTSPPTVSPVSLSYGDEAVGGTSAPQEVTLTNNAALSLTVTRVSASSGWTQTNNCQPSVAPKANCIIKVSFQPASGGQLNGTLTINDYANDSPQTVALDGIGAAPAVRLSEAILNFSGQSVSTTSSSKSVTLTNTGNATLTNLTITASGDFAQTNNCGASVGASGSCKIDVTFTPTAKGNRTGAVTFTDNASGSPQQVSLRGTGGGAAKARLSTASLTFSGQPGSANNSSQSVTLTNTGDETLTNLIINASGDFAQTNNCADSLAASASCTINVTFKSTGNGNRTGALTFTDNASDSPQSVSLSGTAATAGGVLLSTSNLTFPNQPVGTRSSSPQVTVQNTTNQPVNITTIVIGGANNGDFSLMHNCGNSLASSAACQITVTFNPSAAGTRAASVIIVDDAANSPQMISLTGTGVGP